MKCNLCPRCCNADRTVGEGFCHAGSEPEIASVCIHHGEEPPISGAKGITNIFFSHCNLGCVYCQNWQISRPPDNTAGVGGVSMEDRMSPNTDINKLIDDCETTLQQSENIVGFVTGTHYANRIPDIVEGLHRRGLEPVTVYNSSGYERVETLRMIAPYIDVYLPDFKYSDKALAKRYSHAEDYPERALEALEEMYRQKGSALITDSNGLAVSGIIVRHLVLPGCVENSKKAMEMIADISMNLHVSLMAQYYPSRPNLPDELGRTITQDEYDAVVEHFHATGLHNGWLQPLESECNYRPDFSQENPFGNT